MAIGGIGHGERVVCCVCLWEQCGSLKLALVEAGDALVVLVVFCKMGMWGCSDGVMRFSFFCIFWLLLFLCVYNIYIYIYVYIYVY